MRIAPPAVPLYCLSMLTMLTALAACDGSPLDPLDSPEPIKLLNEVDCEFTIDCDAAFDITAAFAQYLYVPRQAQSVTRATHDAVFRGVMTMNRPFAEGGPWEIPIGSSGYGWSKESTTDLDATGPCYTGEGYVSFSGVHTAERSLAPWESKTKTSQTSIDICGEKAEREETQPWMGGGDDGDGFIDEPEYTYCLVDITYWTDTGEIISAVVLYCW